jgi:nucleoside-specific outer membrane channel protein Tsx
MRAASVLLLAFAGAAGAAEFQSVNINALYTTKSKADTVLGTGTDDEKLKTYQFEYFGGLKYGDIYVDAEVFSGDNVAGAGAGSFGGITNWQSLIVFNPRLSLGKLSGGKLGFGPLADVSLIARYERASYADFRTYNHGVSFNFNVPGFAYFESGILRRNTNFYHGKVLWRSVLMSNPLELGGQRVRFNLLSLVNGTEVNGTEVFLRPELLWELDAKGSFQLGVRYEVHRYKVNDRDYSRYSPNVMLKWNL